MPNQDLDEADDDLRAMLAELKANQSRMAEELSRVMAQNERLRQDAEAARQRTANGEQHHKAPPMSEDERWKKMFGGGGLLG